jgi:hypothetical protein
MAGLTVRSNLTGSVWYFASAARTPMTLQSYPPGEYTIINETGYDVQIRLWGRDYTVKDGSTWVFMAHGELRNINTRNTGARRPGQPTFIPGMGPGPALGDDAEVYADAPYDNPPPDTATTG